MPQPWGTEDDYDGWEQRVLFDLADGPLVYCFPGFMGSICERLVARGLVTRQDAGLTPRPEFWPPKKRWNGSPQFHYALAEPA